MDLENFTLIKSLKRPFGRITIVMITFVYRKFYIGGHNMTIFLSIQSHKVMASKNIFRITKYRVLFLTTSERYLLKFSDLLPLPIQSTSIPLKIIFFISINFQTPKHTYLPIQPI